MGHDDEDDRPSLFHHNNNHYDLNTKIMLTAIISLSIVVLLIAILHFYAKCILRRQARRRAVAALESMAVNPTTSQLRSIEPPKTGLDPLIVASLPTFLIKKVDETMECSVCLSSLEENEVARRLPNCKHIFHAECIDKWFESHPNCPICRTEAEPRRGLLAEPREGLAPPTAPPLEGEDYPTMAEIIEGDSPSDTNGLLQSSSSSKVGSNTKLSSFRKILSRERSSRRLQSQSTSGEDGATYNGMYVDLERQQ